MNEEIKKSLTDLIDETLLELEELKKSRFAASEIKIEGPGDGIGGKPSNGKLDAAKSDDDDADDEEDEDEAKKAEGKNEEASKAEGKNEEASKAEVEKADAKEEAKDKKDDQTDKAKDKKDKGEKDAKNLKDDESDKADAKVAFAAMKKSLKDADSLMKSFVEERVKPLEDKLSTIFDLVKQIADQPVPTKGMTARAQPLLKSAEDAGESLSKSEIASKLFELKKSGAKVDSLDITKAEMGQDLSKIVEKYKIS